MHASVTPHEVEIWAENVFPMTSAFAAIVNNKLKNDLFCINATKRKRFPITAYDLAVLTHPLLGFAGHIFS